MHQDSNLDPESVIPRDLKNIQNIRHPSTTLCVAQWLEHAGAYRRGPGSDPGAWKGGQFFFLIFIIIEICSV